VTFDPDRPQAHHVSERPSTSAALLAHMQPGRWYDSRELAPIGGTRFAARLHDAQNGRRCTYECRPKSGTNRYEYRIRAQSDAPPQSPLTPPRSGGCTFSWASDYVRPKPAPLVRCERCGTMWRGGGEHARRIDGSDCLGRRT